MANEVEKSTPLRSLRTLWMFKRRLSSFGGLQTIKSLLAPRDLGAKFAGGFGERFTPTLGTCSARAKACGDVIQQDQQWSWLEGG